MTPNICSSLAPVSWCIRHSNAGRAAERLTSCAPEQKGQVFANKFSYCSPFISRSPCLCEHRDRSPQVFPAGRLVFLLPFFSFLQIYICSALNLLAVTVGSHSFFRNKVSPLYFDETKYQVKQNSFTGSAYYWARLPPWITVNLEFRQRSMFTLFTEVSGY